MEEQTEYPLSHCSTTCMGNMALRASFPQLAMPAAFIFSVGGDMVSFFQEVVDPSVHLDQS